jgi:hemerythrin superfamily protein
VDFDSVPPGFCGADTRHQQHPLDTLRTEHRMIRETFDSFFGTADAGHKRDIGRHLVLLLELHASVEEGVFYPRVQQIDPVLVAQCEHDHEQARRIIEMLKPMDECDAQAEDLFRRLADAVLSHIDDEEQRLFPRIEQAGLDLGAIGHEMLVLEVRMSALHRHPPPVHLRQ